MRPAAEGPVTIELAQTFRYVHEPLPAGDTHIPVLGHADLATTIAQRIEHSAGGAFLIGGFRGAGKTTLVQQVGETLQGSGHERTYAFVTLNVARPVSSSELLFRVMRRLFDGLDDSGLLDLLPPKVRNAMILAYARTSMAIATKNSTSTERSSSASVSVKAAPDVLAGVVPAATLQRILKVTQSLATEASFLTYSDMDVEHDFLRILELLRSTPLRARSIWSRLLGQGGRPPVHVVIVFDELDKLTSEESGIDSLNNILVTLKNVLTSTGMHSVFVGGTELLDASLVDAHEGIGIFESILSWTTYVPCLWSSPGDLLLAVIASADQPDVTLLTNYLQYRARGIPRRLLQELNSMVRWDGGRPMVVVPAHDRPRVELFAELASVVDQYVGHHPGEARSSLGDDRFRLGAYYLLDWVLRTEGGPFDGQQVTRGRRSIGSVLPVADAVVESFLEHLANAGIVDRLSQESAYVTRVAFNGAAGRATYRLSTRVRTQLLAITKLTERERGMSAPWPVVGDVTDTRIPAPGPHPAPSWGAAETSWSTPANPPSPWRTSSLPPVVPDHRTGHGGPRASTTHAPLSPSPTGDPDAAPDFVIPRWERHLGGGRYELDDVIGTGGMSTVYKGKVTATGQPVAVKVLRESMGWDDSVRRRFIQEAHAVSALHHPYVVRTHELVSESDGRMAIVMDYIPGRPLAERITAEPPLTATDSIDIAEKLLMAIHYLHENGLHRLDVKPDNVILRRDGEPVIIDLGIAKPDYSTVDTLAGSLIGTPAYMAPEQLTGERADRSSDVFSLGIVLVEMLTGARLDSGREVIEIMHKRLTEDIPVDEVTCSEELRHVLRKLTARDRGERFANAEEAREALAATPEAMQRPDRAAAAT